MGASIDTFFIPIYDSDGPLPLELERVLLESYLGAASAAHQTRLEGMKLMLLFFTAMWGLLQHGMQLEGMIPPYDGFDRFAYAQETFAAIRASVR